MMIYRLVVFMFQIVIRLPAIPTPKKLPPIDYIMAHDKINKRR